MKWFGVSTLALALAACGDTAESQPKTEPVSKEEQKPKKDELTAADVFKKALAAKDEQKNMHIAMDIDDQVAIAEQEYQLDTKMNIAMDISFEPFAAYQLLKTKMDDEEAEVEWYATNESIYLHDVAESMWFNMPAEDGEDIVIDMPEDLDHFNYLEVFAEYAKDFTVEETDEAYIVKLGEFSNGLKDIMEESLVDELLEEMDEIEEGQEVDVANFDIKKLVFEFTIAKETFFTTGFNLDLDASIEIDGAETVVTQKANMVVSKINELEAIEIPQEVIDNATEYEEVEE